MRKIGNIIATLFFVGFSPVAPGTLASLLAMIIYVFVKGNAFIYYFLTMFLLIIGFWSAGLAEKSFSRKDPPQIVIDEFSSMMLVWFFIPFNPKFLIIGFLLFRFFDIVKIPPLKRLQALPSGFGIMLDDIAAAILTNLILHVLRLFG